MGVAAIALIAGGLQALSTVSGVMQARSQAKQQALEGEQKANAQSLKIRQQASAAKTSFFSSGLLLEGTPLSAIDNIFNAGLEDINRIGTNSNSAIKTTAGNARSKVLSSLSSIASTASFGGGDVSNGLNVGDSLTGNNASFNNSSLPWSSSYKG
jgi:hypothetical protein